MFPSVSAVAIQSNSRTFAGLSKFLCHWFCLWSVVVSVPSRGTWDRSLGVLLLGGCFCLPVSCRQEGSFLPS